MKKFPIYMVNAFGIGSQSGNPAGVCILEQWPGTGELQNMATQLNLPETAFVIPVKKDVWSIRWFSVKHEIFLSGHATLAAAHCLFCRELNARDQILFNSKSGQLKTVLHRDRSIEIELPSSSFAPHSLSSRLVEGLGAYPEAVWLGDNYMCLFDCPETVKSLQPDFPTLLYLKGGVGVIVTAKYGLGKYDFISRYFAPRVGINEDHATGSAHCMLVPFWSKKLGKSNLFSLQTSPRGGEFYCENKNKIVSLRGHADQFLEGKLTI
jgi:PhzF family phenazine biosynthesis protein